MKRLFIISIGCLLMLVLTSSICWAGMFKAGPEDAAFGLSDGSWQGPFRVTSMDTFYLNERWYWRAYLTDDRWIANIFSDDADRDIVLTAFIKDVDIWVFVDGNAWGSLTLNRQP